MKNLLFACARYARAFALIYLCLFLGGVVVRAFAVPLPESIVGMLLLFFALALRIFPEHWLAPGCDVLLRNMTLLFVPVSVGVMVYYPQIKAALVPLFISCVVSSLLVLLVVAAMMQYSERKKNPPQEDS